MTALEFTYHIGKVSKSLRPFALRLTKDVEDANVLYESFKCIKALINTQFGIDAVFKVATGIKTLCLCLDFPPVVQPKERLQTLGLLTVLCAAPHGHK